MGFGRFKGEIIMTQRTRKVCIVGGGAAGMMAAITAARQGAQVTILERNPRVGKKLLATGNGRCNFTNINCSVDSYFGENPSFAHSALASFPAQATIEFFEVLGISHKVEDQGKVFPMSDQAASILDILRYELELSGVNIITEAFVDKLLPKGKGFVIKLKDKSSLNFDRVILAAGGKAMPSSGSDGNGFDLARALGHNIISIFPALVQLKLEGSIFNQVNGVKFLGTAELFDGDKSLATDRGDILFGNYGVSGPPILQLSRRAGQLLIEGKRPSIKLTLIDTMTKGQVFELLTWRNQVSPKKTAQFSLVGLINKRLIPPVLRAAGVEKLNTPVSALSKQDLSRIADILTDWSFNVIGTKSWPSAQVTAGGVDTRQINQSTMESRLVEGLYFAGEIIDIDGLCGGFNLQWAWSSGYLAGLNAAK